MQMLLKLARRGEKPVFVNNQQEFLSLWSVAHAWENLPPESTDAIDIPVSIQAHVDSLLLAFMREGLPLRRANGYRVVGHTFIQTMLGLDKELELIADQLYRKTPLDKSFLDDLHVKRSDLLRWCINEFRQPPACWAISPENQRDDRPEDDEEEFEHGGWYAQLTPRKRKIVATLEVAKQLWKVFPDAEYSDVFHHQLLKDTGLSSVFSYKSFKKWAQPYAPDEAKKPGRRVESDT